MNKELWERKKNDEWERESGGWTALGAKVIIAIFTLVISGGGGW